MTTISATNQRLTCSIVTPRNDQGRPKLYATITDAGIQVWCKHCHAIHLVPRDVCIAAWEQGKSVVSGCDQEVHGSAL